MATERDKAIAALSAPDAVPRLDGDTARELVECFLEELDRKLERIETARREGDAASLQHIAHHLRGEGAGFGFPDITACAARLEQSLLGDEAALASLEERIESLVRICRKAARDQH